MNDNRQQTNIKNVPQRPHITNRKFLSNIQKFKGQNYRPKYKFQPRPIKRSTSTDNFNQYPKQPVKAEEQKPESKDDSSVREVIGTTVGIMDKKLTEFTAKVNSLIELKTKYYVDQRINVLENSNDLLTRGANELAIQADPTNAGNSFQFKYNGDAVARITDGGILYCRNLLVNGLNIITTLNSMMNTESSTAQALSNYVKHSELKDGTYELDVKDTVTDTLDANTGTVDTLTSTDVTVDNDLMVNGISWLNTLCVTPDVNNVLEYPSRGYSNRGLFILNSGGRNIGYSFFCPLTGNGTYVYGLQLGKDLGTGNWGGIRWYHSADNNANNFISMSALDGYDTLRCKKDGTVYIRSPSTNGNSLQIKYEGNLTNGNYQRIDIGDNRNMATYAYGRENNANYAYMKLNGCNCELRIFDTYMNVNGSDGHYFRTTRTLGAIAYFLAGSLANNNTCAIAVGRAASTNSSGSLTYRRATTPLLGLGFYNNDELLTLDTSGNCNIEGSLTAGNAVLAATSVTSLYSAGNATIDGAVDCHKLNITDININTDYLHITASGQTLGNNDYIRCRLSDSAGDGIIDLFHDTMYYGLKLQVPTDNNDDNKLCIYPTGVTINGQLDCYNSVNIWEDLEVSGTVTASTSITTPTLTVTTSGTVAGSNILTESRLWSSGNNYDVIPYTSSLGETNCGKTLNFWSTDSTTSNPQTISYNGYLFEHNSPIGVTSNSSTLAQFYNDTVGATSYMKLGKESSNSLDITYNAASALASRHSTIGVASYPAIDIYYDRVNIAYPLTAPTITASTSLTTPSGTITSLTSSIASITNVDATNIYASNSVSVDGTVLMVMADIADIADNKDYLKLRYEGTLADTHYIRMHMKDSSGNGYIDLLNNAGTYELQLTCDNGQVRLAGDNHLYVPDTECSGTLSVDSISATSGSSRIEINADNIEVTNTNNDAVLQTDNLNIIDTMTLNSVTVNGIATSADVGDDTKINDSTIATTEYIENMNTSTHQEIPDNPYASVPLTDNPYLTWSICSVGTYEVNTDAVCYSEELHQFVMVGSNGHTHYSYDGFTWMNNTMMNYTWSGVVYGATHGYIACTSSNTNIIQSSNGRTWVPHNNVATSSGCAIAYGNSYYAIVPSGNNAGYLVYTTDPTVGTGWDSFWLGSSRKWYNIAYSKSQHKFVVVGSGGYYVSVNDEFASNSRVTAQLSGVTADCHSVCYSEKLNLWVIACNNLNYCYTSTDGITFTQRTLPYTANWHRVVWGGDRFVMTCDNGHKAAYSLDGISWYQFYVSQTSAYETWLGLAYGNGVFVLSGNNTLVATYTSPNSYISPRAMIQQIYPIGSVYISMTEINPTFIFGGYWTQISNKFLFCLGSSFTDPTDNSTKNSSNQTGGEATHTLLTGELPSHNHGIYSGWGDVLDPNTSDVYRYQRWALNDRGWKTTGVLATSATGSDTPHNNMPPFVTVYAWYRYA